MLEAHSKGKTTDALKSLMKLAATTATVVIDGEEKQDLNFTLPLYPKAMISWVRLGNLQKGEQKKRLWNNPKPYFNFKMSLGVQSRYSHNFAKMEKSILVTLFLQ